MLYNKLIGNYAKALFNVALNNGIVDVVKDQIILYNNVLNSSNSIKKLMLSKFSIDNHKEIILNSLITKCGFNEIVHNLLNKLLENNKLYLLPEITNYYNILYNQHNNIVPAKITVSKALKKQEEIEFMQILSKKLNKSFKPEFVVNASILGGFIIKFDGYMLDASTLYVLSNLTKI